MSSKQLFIITGEKGQGKTSLLIDVIEILQNKNISLFGFYAKGFWENNKRSGFDLVNIKTGKSIPLCKSQKAERWEKYFSFYFNPEALKAGNQILNPQNINTSDLVIIDEIGKLDINGEIWHDAVSKLISEINIPMLLVVRKSFVEEVINYWGITNATIFELGKDDAKTISKKIISKIGC